MIVKTLRVLMAAAAIFLATTQAHAEYPIKDNIESPEYVLAPDLSKQTIQSRDRLSLYFSQDYNRCRAHYGNDEKLWAACSRKRDLTGRKVETGVTITPAIEGEWKWDSDSELTFTPKQWWKAGEKYTVTADFDALHVPAQVMISGKDRQFTGSFTTQALTLSVPKMEYMQDPDNPDKKLVSAKIESNYPVTAASLDSRIHVEMEQTENNTMATTGTLKPEIKHNDESAITGAWVTAILPDTSETDRFMRLTIDAGVEPKHGGSPSPQPGHERVRVPGLSGYLTISNASTTAARLPDTTPQQVLSFATNIKAAPDAVLKNVKLYLLPKQHPVAKLNPGTGKKDDIYKWKAGEVTPEILAQSENVPLSLMPSPDKFATTFTYSYLAPAGRYLWLVADKGMTAFGGYTLGRPFETLLTAPQWPHDLDIMQQGSILTLSGSHKLSLHSRGADSLQVDVAHIRTEVLQHFISQTSGDISNPDFNYNFGKEDISVIDTKDLPVTYESPQASQYAVFDFSPYLKEGRKGMFLVTIQGYREKKAVGGSVSRFVLVSDLGLLVKKNAYIGRDVFLMSFQTGKAVSSADISVLGRNGLSIYKGKTDADGHTALPDFTNFARDRAPVAIVAQKGGDYSFIPYDRSEREVNTSRFEVGGSVGSEKGLKALVYSDRGIYRPGDSVHLGAMIHNPNWILPPSLPLRMVVTDPRGRKIRDEILKFSDPGMNEINFDTGEAWPTGTYRASLYIALDDDRRGDLLDSASFRVEEFQPDLLRIKTSITTADGRPLGTDGWSAAAGLKADVTLTNLYGTPASERRITGSVTLNPTMLSFPAYSDYRFYDSYAAKQHTVEYKLSDAKTDAQGRATLTLDADQKPAATYNLTLQTQGFEAGSGKGVTAYTTVMISPMEYAVGSATNDNIGYIHKNDPAKISLIAVDPALKKIAVSDLSLDLVRTSYVSTLVRHEDGSYAYESVRHEDAVSSKPFAIDAKGTVLNLPTGELGDFAYRIKNSKGLLVEQIDFAVTGEGERPAGANREAVLKVAANKPKYEEGETMELTITAPYTGAGLITLESDHVLTWKWFQTAKTDTVQSIAIPKDFSGKGYVSVAFVRDINSREIYLSPMSYAVIPFTANMKKRTTAIDLTLPEKVKPGEPVTVRYHGSARGKVVIYAVDEGILQVARYRTPDPVRRFLLDRALQVATMQMLDLLMPEFSLVRKLSSVGGDGSDDAGTAALGKHLNPFKRKTLAPAVFWSGVVDLDTADKTVTFTPPGHFNGEMRVMAVASTGGSIGATEKKLTVQGDIIITPNTPVFLAPGDESHASITLANNIKGSGTDAKFTLSAQTTDGLLATGLPDSVTVAEDTEKTFDFTVKARDNPGPASLTVTAATAMMTQKAEATLSVRPPLAKETTLTAGYSDTGNAKLELTRRLYPAFAERDITMSPLPNAYIFSLLRYLDGYPYGCTEQTLSKAFPQVTLSREPEFLHDRQAMADKIEDAVNTLRRRQTSDGGFSYWDGESDANPFITAYGTEFLVRAREAGFPVPPDLVEGALRNLREETSRDVRGMDDAREKAYGIYVLTSSGYVTTDQILHLLKYFEDEKNTNWKTDLTAVYIAASYQLMQQGEMAKATLDDFDKGLSADEMKYENWRSMAYNPFIKDARYISLLARHFPDRLRAMDPNLVFTLATFIREQRYSTLSSNFAIAALTDYQKTAGKDLASAPPILTADGKTVAFETIGPMQHAPLPPDAHSLALAGPKASLFYTVSETGYDRDVPEKPVSQNMQIERSYETPDGKPVTGKVALGDVVDAVIKINAFDNRTVENVAIVDLLPGGFELALDQQYTGSSLSYKFVDKREDRLIAFGTVDPTTNTFRYRMRATNKGTFIVPPPYAEAMYDVTTKARGKAAEVTVTDAP